MNRKQKIVRVLLLLALVAGSVYVYRNADISQLTPEAISARLRAAGHWGVIGYVLLLTLLPLLLFPDSVLVMAGGMVFGLAKGTVLTSIGSLLGGMLAYFIARWLGHGVVKKLIRTDNLVDMTSGRRGFFLILILRLVPLFPFKVVSYSAGLAGVDWKEFALATLVGSMPGILVYTNLGDKVHDIRSPEFVFAVVLLILLTVVFTLAKRILDKRQTLKENDQ
ncbi:MAG: TVP38/TMEM64 family protein [Tissierellia bacterium]|jgi:uncharacterized membrane protein YdjX (TVP38/TMEM64 family)|nr:TVP38/TMEM64 family protein [Tissierellia bacterium]